MRGDSVKQPDVAEPIDPVVADWTLRVIRRHNEIIEKYRNGAKKIDVTSNRGISRVKAFRTYVEWSLTNGFNPDDYFEALYVLSAPKMPPVLRDHRAKYEYEKLISYKRLRDGPKGILAGIEQSAIAFTNAHEAVRRNAVLGGTPVICFLQQDVHGLYDPRSEWCAQCSLAMQCAVKINMSFGRDVVSLRRSSRR